MSRKIKFELNGDGLALTDFNKNETEPTMSTYNRLHIPLGELFDILSGIVKTKNIELKEVARGEVDVL